MNKHIFVSMLLVGIVSPSLAQGNLPYVDQKPIHFGFSVGFGTMNFGVTTSRRITDGNDFFSDVTTTSTTNISLPVRSYVYDVRVSSLSPMLSVGIITDLLINRYLNLRFTPTLNFGSRDLTYSLVDVTYSGDNWITGSNVVSTSTTTTKSIPLCLPVYIKYSAERKHNYRPYLIVGGGMSIDLATDPNDPVLLNPFDFYTEFGVGCDFYLPFFKLCPELKYSIGFNNMFVPLSKRDAGSIKITDQKYSNALSILTSQILTLSFNFE